MIKKKLLALSLSTIIVLQGMFKEVHALNSSDLNNYTAPANSQTTISTTETLTTEKLTTESFSTETLTTEALTTNINTETPTVPNTTSVEIPQMTLSEFQQTINTELGAYQNLNYADVFSLMKNSLNAGEGIDLAQAMTFSGITIPSNSMFDMSATGIDMSLLNTTSLNFEYASLISGMNESYQITDVSSQSTNAVELFKKNFGDLSSQYKTGEATLPKNMTLKKLTKANNKAINKEYKEAYKDGGYKNVRSSINVSGLFDATKKTTSTGKASDEKKLKEQVAKDSAKKKQEAQNKKNASKITIKSNTKYRR